MDIPNYADDTTRYACCKDFDLLIEKLEVKANEILQWYNQNAMKVNADRCHLLLPTRVIIDNKLSFNEHRICDEASQKLNGQARLSSFMSLEKRRLIMEAFVNLDTALLYGCSIIEL